MLMRSKVMYHVQGSSEVMLDGKCNNWYIFFLKAEVQLQLNLCFTKWYHLRTAKDS